MTIYSKGILLLTGLFCYAGNGHAQSETVDFKSISISIKKNGEQETQRIKKTGDEAHKFDITQFITDNIDQAQIQIFGSAITDGEKIKMHFDSKKIDRDNRCLQFCEELVEIEQLPMLGVSTQVLEDFSGVEISQVIPGSAAEDAGLLIGDVITVVEMATIASACDLTIAVQGNHIEDEVHIEFTRNGKKEKTSAILGYRLQKKITWTPCCDTQEETSNFSPSLNNANKTHLTLFPNPTTGISYIEYKAEQEGTLQFFITDMAGREIYREERSDFNGYFSKYLDLTKESAGLYFINIIQGEQIYQEKLVVHKY